MNNELKPGIDGMPPIKNQYDSLEKSLIAAKVTELGTAPVAEAYGIKWQVLAAWKRYYGNDFIKKSTYSKIIIQSPLGGSITTDEIIDKIGVAGVDKIYVRVDENAAYWVKGDESGSVTLW